LLTLLLLATILPTATGICESLEFDSQGWPENKIQLLVVSVGFFGEEGGSLTPLKFNSAFTLKKNDGWKRIPFPFS